MSISRTVQRLLAGAVCLAAACVAGCASRYSAETRIGGRPVVYRSAVNTDPSVTAFNQDTATFSVGEFKFTIDQTRITWGRDQALALPSNWKRVEFIDAGRHIAVRVDGTTVGEIRPAA